MPRSISGLWLGVVAVIALSASGPVRGAPEQGKAAGAAGVGTANGQFTVNGKTVTLTSAVVKATADSFDSSKQGYTLVLSDVKGLPDKYGSLDKVTAGTLHFIELTLGHDRSVYGAMLHHSGFKNHQVSSAGSIKLEVEKFGPDVLAGKVYTAAPRTLDGTTFQFTATFTALIEKEK
jgi:hypothetical protein